MAKNLHELPVQFEELDKVFRGDEESGLSVGSAEGGWRTPSKSDWGKRRKRSKRAAPAPQPHR
jgi:hypothetical protein